MADSTPKSTSPRFEVAINGNETCVAGAVGNGVISITMTWVKRDRAKLAAAVENGSKIDEARWNTEELELNVSGLVHNPPEAPDQAHVQWAFSQLKPGDEIRIRVLEPGTFDAPVAE